MHQRIRPSKHPIKATLTIPGAKGISQRAIFLASLAEGVSEIKNLHQDQSTHDLINTLKQTGIVIQYDEISNSCIIAGCNGKLPNKQGTLWCETIDPAGYYLIGMASLSNNVYFFDCPEPLRAFLSHTLMNVLIQQGIQTIPQDAEQMPCTLMGADGLKGGDINFDNPLHSQVSSTLLMIAPYAKQAFSFNFNLPYQTQTLDLTCAVMADFGVLVHRIQQNHFMIPVPQHYHARSYTIEPDMVIASYLFGATVITAGEIKIQAFKSATSKQPHVKILSALEKMGCQIKETNAGFILSAPPVLKGIEISLRLFSEVFLVLAAIAPFANEPTKLNHIGATTDEEAFLLNHFSQGLSALNIQVEVGTDWIKILPSKPIGARVDTHHDYRLGMAYAMLAMRIPNIVIENADCVTNVYPDFFERLEELGEDVKVDG